MLTKRSVSLSLLIVAGLFAECAVFAQARQPATQRRQQTAGTARTGTPARNTSASRNTAAPQRPSTRPTETRLSPEIEQLLVNWSRSSSLIKRLQGEHRRRVYDHVFHVEKRSQGVFFYEASDKGRIDISSTVIPKGEVSKKLDDKKRPYKLQADEPEKWVCDGTRVFSINITDKEAQVFEIPERARGENIMNGPLPFLFGMPPELAKKRYVIAMAKSSNPKYHSMKIKPRWQQDAANWREANIILDRKSFLPIHVQLIHPTGNTETVYSFGKMQVNRKPAGIFSMGRDPFKPKLAGYRVNTLDEKKLKEKSKEMEQRRRELQNIASNARQSVVPDVRGYPHQDAKARLVKLGLTVKFLQGPPAKTAADKYKVVAQSPNPLADIPKNKVVHLKLYTAPKTAARAASSTRTR